MWRPVLVLLVCFNGVYKTNGKTFAICELVTELKHQGFPEDQISDWLCLVEAESSRRSDVIGGPDDDGSFDYGLFQINDRYWCSADHEPGKGCDVTCSDLLNSDISIASECAKRIYEQQGFDAWLGWKKHCRDKENPEIRC